MVFIVAPDLNVTDSGDINIRKEDFRWLKACKILFPVVVLIIEYMPLHQVAVNVQILSFIGWIAFRDDGLLNK